VHQPSVKILFDRRVPGINGIIRQWLEPDIMKFIVPHNIDEGAQEQEKKGDIDGPFFADPDEPGKKQDIKDQATEKDGYADIIPLKT
jgi:hypothetical protein